MFAPLFAATRQQLQQKIRELLPNLDPNQIKQMIADKKIRAIIRAAAIWFPYSAELHCVTDPEGIFVIHGPRTELGDSLDKHIKTWATSQLAEISASAEQSRKWPRSVIEEITAKPLADHNEAEIAKPNI
ncbi:MAG: hypothetical protein M3R00_05875 [Pseudomonadota bacterium]|nr:hypothetical protein [Pseudomonadota bacterium]